MNPYFTVSSLFFRRLKTDVLTCGFNLVHVAPFLNNKYQFHRRRKTQITARYNIPQIIIWTSTVKGFLSRWRKLLDKPNNIAMHKLPSGRSKFKMGLKLMSLAYETGCAGKNMKSSLEKGFCGLDCHWLWLWRRRYTILKIEITSRHASWSEQGHGDKVEGGPFSSQRAKTPYMEKVIGAWQFLEMLFLKKL